MYCHKRTNITSFQITTRIASVLLFQFLLNSCTYELTDYYENPVNTNPTPPDIIVVQLDLEVDTIYAYGGRTVSFQFKSSDQAIQGTKLLINNVAIDSVASGNGKLEFQGWEVKNGIHELTLQIYTKSGTGSLIDKLGGESFVMSRKWVLLVDDTRSDNTKCSAEDGYLKVSWETYKASNFKSYIVARGGWDPKAIAETQSTQYIDSTYIGEANNYAVYVKLKDGSQIGWGSVSLPNCIPTLYYEATPDNEYYVWWNKSKYYNAIGKYNFILNYNTISESTNVNDTIYKLNLQFNTTFDFTLNVVPKILSDYYKNNQSNFKSNIWARTGIKTKLLTLNRVVHSSKDTLMYWDSGDVYTYQISTNTQLSKQSIIEDQHLWNTTISPRGKYLMGTYTTESSTRTYIIKDLKTGIIKKIPDYESYTGGSSTGIILTDSGSGLIRNYSGYNVMYDYFNKKVLAYFYEQNISSSCKISSDGKYFINDLNVYKLDSNMSSMVKIFTVANYNSFYGNWGFDPTNPNLLTLIGYGNVLIYQCDKATKLYELKFSDEVIHIDYYNKEILCSDRKILKIRSLTDGTLLKEIPFEVTYNNYSHYSLYNHHIYGSNAYAYKVNM